MNDMKKAVVKSKKEKGAAAVEYAIMLALIVVVCISAVSTIGQKASSAFSRVAGAI